MRVVITGSRSWSDFSVVAEKLGELCQDDIVAHGACSSGADRIAHCLLRWRGIQEIQYPADWATHGRAAGPMRNSEMLKDFKPDVVWAFMINGGTPGTKDCVRKAEAMGIPVEIFED